MPTRSEISDQVWKEIEPNLNRNELTISLLSPKRLWAALEEAEFARHELADEVGKALVEASLAPGESQETSEHSIVNVMHKMRLRAEEAEGRLQQNGWISVEEREPEYDTDVLIWGTGWDAVYVGYWRHSCEWIGRHRAESDAELPRTNPTHWQPLPAAPGADAEVTCARVAPNGDICGRTKAQHLNPKQFIPCGVSDAQTESSLPTEGAQNPLRQASLDSAGQSSPHGIKVGADAEVRERK